MDVQTGPPVPILGGGCQGSLPTHFPNSTKDIDEAIKLSTAVVIQHAGGGGAMREAGCACQLSTEELALTCLTPLPLLLLLLPFDCLFNTSPSSVS